MRTLIITTLFMAMFCGNIMAQTVWTSKLQVGDILLQPLHCWVCSLIEAQTSSPYSHVGVVGMQNKKLVVFEAWQSVRAVSLAEYMTKTQKDSQIEVLRLNDSTLNPAQFSRDYFELFNGASYDAKFLWDNFDSDGKESLYCSELVAKLYILQGYDISPRPMIFDVNPLYWERFFRGPAPNGQLGLAPAHFTQLAMFSSLGFLQNEN
jgi:hypothetical protein